MKQTRPAAGTIAIALLSCCISVRLSAYEIVTHAVKTREAYQCSALGQSNGILLRELGIEVIGDTLGSSYRDFSDTAVVTRFATDFDIGKIKLANQRSQFAPESTSIAGWLMRGVIREDDVPYDPSALENNPQDEPGGNFARVFAHFFDPYNDRPLTSYGVAAGPRAPDWVLSMGAFIPAAPTITQGGVNRFGIAQAREAEWRALTLTRRLGTGWSNVPAGPTAGEKEAERRAYWATMFRALGDSVHLLQDMAQPQHTRNDAHAGLRCDNSGTKCGAGHASFYEKYIEARAAQARSFQLPEGDKQYSRFPAYSVTAKPLDLGCRYKPVFRRFRDYFATATGTGNSFYCVSDVWRPRAPSWVTSRRATRSCNTRPCRM